MSADSPSSLPLSFGRYRVLRKLGAGGMGTVYLAQDTELEREVALKVPRLDEDAGTDVIERFKREARVAARIQHADVCPIWDVGQSDNVPYMVMPFIEGTSLAGHVGREHLWPVPQAVELVRRLALALSDLHGRGLMHRDLKPGNVMIRPDGSPVIMDFGLARSFEESGHRLTSKGRVVGTPSYMAPEQVLGDPQLQGPGIDIYALGVLLYEMLTGNLPFVGPLVAVVGQILHGTTRPPSSFRADLGQEIDALVLKAMARQVEDRYSSMAEFAGVLERFHSQGSSGSLPPSLSSTNPGTAPSVSPATLTDTGLVIRCPGCSGRLRVPNTTQGKNVVCPRCKTRFASPSHESGLPPRLTNSIGMEFVLIPAGTFVMGSPKDEKGRDNDDEGPQHEVEITRPFYLGVYQVTQEQYEQVMGNNPSDFSAKGKGREGVQGMDTSQFPVERVSWEEAMEFCRKLSTLPEERSSNHVYRLPTEAEWEYSCRGGAGSTYPFHFGQTLTSHQANFDGNGPYGTDTKGPYLERTTRVGSYAPNAFGLYDMHGNVWEWCHDWYAVGYYTKSPPRDPQGPDEGWDRVFRGGGWDSYGRDCRSAFRFRYTPTVRFSNLGFRVALVPSVK